MIRKFSAYTAIFLFLSAVVLTMSPVTSQALPGGAVGRARTTGVVYVTGQGLYYDTFVPADPLPPKGRFQELIPGAGPGGVSITEFGPGDPGYLGGRWWVDANGNGEMDDEDVYLLCPLLGPGRITP